MELPFSTENIDEIPEEYRPLYKEQDGKHSLAIPGAVEKKRLDEFRNSNIQLRKDLDAMKAKYKDFDPEKIQSMQTEYDKLLSEHNKKTEEELIAKKDVEELRKTWTKQLVEDRDKGFAERDSRIQTLDTQLRRLLITDKIKDAGIKAGFEEWAILDATRLLSDECGFDDQGLPVVYDRTTNGQEQIRYGKDGERLTIPERLAEMAEQRPGWRKQSSGGGAQHQGGAGGARVTQKPIAQWGRADRLAYIREHGHEAYIAATAKTE